MAEPQNLAPHLAQAWGVAGSRMNTTQCRRRRRVVVVVDVVMIAGYLRLQTHGWSTDSLAD